MTNNNWDFRPNQKPSSEQIKTAYHKGWYREDKETFWIEKENKKIGLIIIHDISDTIPLFDICLDNNARGKGIGTNAVNWITDYIFSYQVRRLG